MALHIVLIEPEIPNNTGNIGRLALATGSTLHLVKPFGFELTDKRLKRAGLDYWPHLELVVHESIEAFFGKHKNKKMALFSSHSEKEHWSIDFEDEMFLIFGKESVGLPQKLTEKYPYCLYKIPLYSPHVRSLNLANAVGIVIYEGLRQLR
ncbi:tRNA (cytidine(34)-2'-O)-methyltransferase [Pareuzebyella sediminis]|uniref:tRNA (cytidine(34)-2'-O)-methyltransferase n=1 Tax=Pareuzebyella sediminis TaxID=2607998 RepID=UPI0011EE745E|nr:tRNA (cytidine(34)-2'-O)-methyltransferase [Pareuzebyella sediminis]